MALSLSNIRKRRKQVFITNEPDEFINGDIDNNCDEQQTVASNCFNVLSTEAKIKSQSGISGKIIRVDFVIHEHFVPPIKIEQIMSQHPKPYAPLSFLIYLALKNSQTGCLAISEMFKFISYHFPYYEDVPKAGWKRSLRSSLTSSNTYVHVECKLSSKSMWYLNTCKAKIMEMKVKCWVGRNCFEIKKSMSNPAILELMAKGGLKENFCTCSRLEDHNKDENLDKVNSVSSPLEITESTAAEKVVISMTSKREIIYDKDVKIEVKEELKDIEDFA